MINNDPEVPEDHVPAFSKREMQEKKQTPEERRKLDARCQEEKLWVLLAIAPLADADLDKFTSRLSGGLAPSRDREKLALRISQWLVHEMQLRGERHVRGQVLACARNVLNDRVAELRREIRDCEVAAAQLDAQLEDL